MTLAVAYAVAVGGSTLLSRPAYADEAPKLHTAQTAKSPSSPAARKSAPLRVATAARVRQAAARTRASERVSAAERQAAARIAEDRPLDPVAAAKASSNACRRLEHWTHDDQGAGLAVVQAAQRLLGCPYRFGGNNSAGFDCSGLVWYIHQLLRMPIPRRAEEQSLYAADVPEDKLKPGDLVFFHFAEGDPRGSYIDFQPSYINHVGIYAGNGRFIHAPKDGKVVSYARMVDFKPYFLKAGRYWSGAGMLARE